MWGRVLASRADGVRVSLRSLPGRTGPNSGLELSHGRLARLTPGSALLCAASELTLLATATRGAAPPGFRRGTALLVDFRAKAAGKGLIPMTWMRREMQPAASETLTARFIDRALRPNVSVNGDQLQLSISQLSGRREATVPVDALAVNAASAAMLVAGDMLATPVGAARVCLCGDQVLVFPAESDCARAEASALVAVVGDRVVSFSLETNAGGISNDAVLQLIEHGVKAAQAMVPPQVELAEKARAMRDKEGRSFFPRQMPVPVSTSNDVPELATAGEQQDQTDWIEEVYKIAYSGYEAAFVDCRRYPGKSHRAAIVSSAQQSIIDRFPDADMDDVLSVAGKAARAAHRDVLLRDQLRIDGRRFNEVRSVRCEAGVLPGDVHGSAIFERGDTQVLALATIGLGSGAQKTEQYLENGRGNKRFFVHYAFPPYATGETGRFSGAMSRREVGHSALAEQALTSVLEFNEHVKNEENENYYPYVIRMNAEVTSSDGSSSMASVCAGTLALQDAGAPICNPVSGVAMGLIAGPHFNENESDFVILTDILGAEDHFGDMDMKVTGTSTNVTACQLDVKVANGIPLAVISKALDEAQKARCCILESMTEAAKGLRKAGESPPHAPRVVRVKVDKAIAVKALMRNQAEGLRGIEDATGARLSFGSRSGILQVEAPNSAAAELATNLIQKALGDLEIGSKMTVRVTDVKSKFAIVESLDENVEGLLHVSKMQTAPTSPVSIESAVENELDSILPPTRKFPDARNLLKKGDILECVVLECDRAKGVLRFGYTGPPPRKPKKSAAETVTDFLDVMQSSAGST